MSHDHRKDRVTRGMMIIGGAYPGVSKNIAPPLLEPPLEELSELEQRLQSVRERIERIKSGDFS